MNNAVFGKSMENVRKYQEIQLVTTQRTMDKLVANPRYKYNVAFPDTFTAVSMGKEKIILNKPIYTGFAILDISKELMYRFHYDYITTKYGKRATLLFTDTDSLCYHIKTGDAYEDMVPDKDQWFDCSAYPYDHFLHDLRNKKVIGMMKDEFPGDQLLIEFVGLRPKMYSGKGLNGGKKVAKGVSKRFVDKCINHDHYKAALETIIEQKAKFQRIRASKHNLYTVEQVKVSLSAYDDKRYILPDGHVELLP